MPKALMMLAAAVAVQSCASKDGLQTRLPPVADLKVQPEPAYPVEALTDADAERRWNDAVLIWGRDGWRQVGRLCRWANGMGATVECGAE
jgi:hypothetical protein